MFFHVHQALPLGTLMSKVDLNSDLILLEFFIPEQFAKFDELKALNVTLL